MADIFPRLNIQLNNAAGVLAPAAARSIEAIKQDVIAQLSRISIGTPLKAEVIAQLDDGSFIANVANIPLRLVLPGQPKIGDKFNLLLLQTNPRLTFSLDGKQATAIFDTSNQTMASVDSKPSESIENSLHLQNPESIRTNFNATKSTDDSVDSRIRTNVNKEAATLLGGKFKEALNAYQVALKPSESSSQIELSLTAQILATVLSETKRPGLKLAIEGTEPLADDITARVNPSKLAQRIETQLNQQIEHSGLFYESHLTKWATGKKDLSEIQLEPQSRLSLELESTVLTDIHEANHAALTQLVHQQLDVLDQGRLAWLGNLTETVSLKMQIEVDQDETHQATTESEPNGGQTWRTKLTLHFPKLGEVEVEISHREQSSDIRCIVESPEIVQTLHDHAKELIKAFDNSGNQLHSMKVSSK